MPFVHRFGERVGDAGTHADQRGLLDAEFGLVIFPVSLSLYSTRSAAVPEIAPPMILTNPKVSFTNSRSTDISAVQGDPDVRQTGVTALQFINLTYSTIRRVCP
jgi:hypothetical protein